MHTKRRLLLVEDEPELRALLARMLGALYMVDLAASLEEAVACVTAEPTYDGVLCDLGLAGRSALDLHATLAPPLSERFVVMTGSDGPELRQLNRLFGEGRVLLKPFTRAEVLRSIESVLPGPAGP